MVCGLSADSTFRPTIRFVDSSALVRRDNNSTELTHWARDVVATVKQRHWPQPGCGLKVPHVSLGGPLGGIVHINVFDAMRYNIACVWNLQKKTTLNLEIRLGPKKNKLVWIILTKCGNQTQSRQVVHTELKGGLCCMAFLVWRVWPLPTFWVLRLPAHTAHVHKWCKDKRSKRWSTSPRWHTGVRLISKLVKRRLVEPFRWKTLRWILRQSNGWLVAAESCFDVRGHTCIPHAVLWVKTTCGHTVPYQTIYPKQKDA